MYNYGGAIYVSKGVAKIVQAYTKGDNLYIKDKFIFLQKKEIDKIIKKAIAEKLLEMKNKYWLSNGEKEFTLEDMFENMKLKEVGITENKVELYFSENGMFDNHRIVINLDKIGNKYNYFGVGI